MAERNTQKVASRLVSRDKRTQTRPADQLRVNLRGRRTDRESKQQRQIRPRCRVWTKLIVAWGTGPEPILDEEPATPTTIRNVSKAYKIDHKDWDVLPCDPTHNREEDILDEEGNVIGVDYGGLLPQSFLDDHEYDWSDSYFGIRPGHLKSWQPDDDYVSFQPRRVARCQRFSPHTGGEWSTVGPAISVVTSGGHS